MFLNREHLSTLHELHEPIDLKKLPDGVTNPIWHRNNLFNIQEHIKIMGQEQPLYLTRGEVCQLVNWTIGRR
jgi:hypothetical protein